MLKLRPILAVALVLLAAGPTAGGARASGDTECAKRVEVVIWTANRHRFLMRALAANPAPCTDYWISIPAADNDKTLPRAAGVYREVRDLGPNFHPLVEVVLADTGWARWVAEGHGSWYDAGVEMRRRMTFLRPDLGETWLLNEFDRTTRVDGERNAAEIKWKHTVPYTRAAMKELVRGLYEGAPGMEPLPGAVEIGIPFSHQNLPDVPGYKAALKSYLQDADFWGFLKGKVRWLLHEAYADTRNHGVPGSTLEERRSHLLDYVFHLRELARAGGRHTTAADRFLEDAFVPFVNGGGYVGLGGDAFDFTSGHGNTEVPLDQMMKFASEQIFAVRDYAESHRGEPLAKRIGFSWQPQNRRGLPVDQFEAEVVLQAERLAEAFRWAYGPGSSPAGACVAPGTVVDWCTSERAGALFVETWQSFRSWK
jgi:hypothetical protein